MITDLIDDYFCPLCASTIIRHKSINMCIKCDYTTTTKDKIDDSHEFRSVLKRINYINHVNIYRDENTNDFSGRSFKD